MDKDKASRNEKTLMNSFFHAVEESAKAKKYDALKDILRKTVDDYGLYAARTFVRKFFFHTKGSYVIDNSLNVSPISKLIFSDTGERIIYRFLDGQIYTNSSYGDKYIRRLINNSSDGESNNIPGFFSCGSGNELARIFKKMNNYSFWIVECGSEEHPKSCTNGEKCKRCDQIYLYHDFDGFRNFLVANGRTDFLSELDNYLSFGDNEISLLFFSSDFLKMHSDYFYKYNVPSVLKIPEIINRLNSGLSYFTLIFDFTFDFDKPKKTKKNILRYLEMGVDPDLTYCQGPAYGNFSVIGYLLFYFNSNEWFIENYKDDGTKLIAEAIAGCSADGFKKVIKYINEKNKDFKIDKIFGMALLNILLFDDGFTDTLDSYMYKFNYLVEELGIPATNKEKLVPDNDYFFAGKIIDNFYYESEPIIMACRSPAAHRVIDCLVKKGADINMVDAYGNNLFTLCMRHHYNFTVRSNLENHFFYKIPQLSSYFYDKNLDLFQTYKSDQVGGKCLSNLQMLILISYEYISNWRTVCDNDRKAQKNVFLSDIKRLIKLAEERNADRQILFDAYNTAQEVEMDDILNYLQGY